MSKIKCKELQKVKIKIDFRNNSQLHAAIVLKLVNLGFKKDGTRTLNCKKDFYIFVENMKFREAHRDSVYNEQYRYATLDDLYDLQPFIPQDTRVTLSDSRLVKLSKKLFDKISKGAEYE